MTTVKVFRGRTLIHTFTFYTTDVFEAKYEVECHYLGKGLTFVYDVK